MQWSVDKFSSKVVKKKDKLKKNAVMNFTREINVLLIQTKSDFRCIYIHRLSVFYFKHTDKHMFALRLIFPQLTY